MEEWVSMYMKIFGIEWEEAIKKYNQVMFEENWDEGED